MLCSHSAWKLYRDPDTNGLWGLCTACDAQTRTYVRGTDAELRVCVAEAMAKIEREELPKRSRGRPRVLGKTAKRRIFVLDDSHMQKLERFKKKRKLANNSEGIRRMIEEIPL